MATIQLTPEMSAVVQKNSSEPVRVVDPATNQTYVLLHEATYQRLQTLLYDDSALEIREAYPLMDDAAAKAGWSDPAMDVYNDLAPPKQP